MNSSRSSMDDLLECPVCMTGTPIHRLIAINYVPSQSWREKDQPKMVVTPTPAKQEKIGTTCHQCRQKIKGLGARCTNNRKGKPCPNKFCHKCLMNRYGEVAEEKSVLKEWKLSKCRGICNCSVCMKRRGQEPTGKLVHTAKANAFASVSELLHGQGPKSALVLSKCSKVTDEGD